MRRMKLYAEKLPNPKYIPKPYKPASFPGEKVQIEFDSLADFKKQLARRNRICNAFPMRPLGWDSPNECLEKFRLSVT